MLLNSVMWVGFVVGCFVRFLSCFLIFYSGFVFRVCCLNDFYFGLADTDFTAKSNLKAVGWAER